MTTPMIAVLRSDTNQLRTPVDIMKYIIWEYICVPKNINDSFSDSEISFVYNAAQYGDDANQLAGVTQAQLINMLNIYFPNSTTYNTCNVDVNWIDDVRYALVIDMATVINGQSYAITQDFAVDSSNNFVITFDGN